MNYAKNISDELIIGIYRDSEGILSNSLEFRINVIKNLNIADSIKVIDANELNLIMEIEPDFIIKGPEHQGKVGALQEKCQVFGGQIIFTSANNFENLSKLPTETETLIDFIKVPHTYRKRHSIDKNNLLKIIERFSKLNVCVIGDLIVDEYIDSHPIGMSQEDPTIVVSPQKKQLYLGGSGIVAAHINGLGANVDYFSIVGPDETGTDAADFIERYGFEYNLFVDGTRKTTLKQRIRAKNKTLLRMNTFTDHDLDDKISDKIYFQIKKKIKEYDLILLSDFNYGCLPSVFANRITALAKKNNIPVVADSQASSQISDISRFKNTSFVFPTEHEARLAMSDTQSNLVVLAENLSKKMNTDHLVITLGESGVLIYNGTSTIKTDRIEALSAKVVDPAGAGDALMSVSALAMVSKASIWESLFLGSIMAAFQVSRVGNIPLRASQIKEALEIL